MVKIDVKGAERRWLLFVAPLVVGAFLRFYRVSRQVFIEDEVHSLRAILDLNLSQILSTYGNSDFCIPLTALAKIYQSIGIGPSELLLRLPSLVFGVLLILLLPCWILRTLPEEAFRVPVAAIVSWMIALSPILVYYSRTARPYSAAVTLSCVALLGFEHWLRSDNSRLGLVGFLICAPLATYFHLGFVPFVASVVLYGIVMETSSKTGKGLFRVLGAGIAFGVLTLLLHLPAIVSLSEMVGEKRRVLEYAELSVLDVLRLVVGTDSSFLLVGFFGFLLLGAVELFRQSRRLFSFLLVPSLVQMVGLLFLSPYGMDKAHVWTRYHLGLVPFAFVLVAIGMVSLVRSAAGSPLLLRVFSTAFLALLFLSGPFVDGWWYRSNFTQSGYAVYFWRHSPVLALPDPYLELVPGTTILEYPWHSTSRFVRVLDEYQRLHRHQVIVISGEARLHDKRVRFRNMTSPDTHSILNSSARYLVVHTQLLAESTSEVRARRAIQGKGAEPDSERAFRTRALKAFEVDVVSQLAIWGDRFGPPQSSKDGLIVWDLHRVREKSVLGGP